MRVSPVSRSRPPGRRARSGSPLLLLAFCALLSVAVTHVHEPRMMRLSTGIYGLVVGASLFIVLAHDRPFVGEISVQPLALVRVLPQAMPKAALAVPATPTTAVP